MSGEGPGFYVHVPFCLKRCPYCAFTLVESKGELHEAFTAKAASRLRSAGEAPRTLYFGGGTPSLLETSQIARLIEAAGGRPREVTVEANPERFDAAGLRAAGATRLTLGIQSLQDGVLRFLGRGHDAAGARRAWREASARFDNVCVDLIFAVPGLDRSAWKATLDEVRSWAPAHVSLYGLTYEPGTPFERIRERLPEAEERAQYEMAMDAFADWRHYEISNWARPGFESLHNRSYWEGRPYLGFGPGAHGYRDGRRWWNVRNVRAWLERDDEREGEEVLTPEQIRIERLLLGLRQEAGLELDSIPPGLEAWLERREGRVRLTRAGRCVADSVISKLV
jgi:oxygen-independent coproporphyrinogen-3 oxidase